MHRISEEEAKFKLVKVKKVARGPKGVPYLITTDGRTLRYPDPLIKTNDSILLELESNKIKDSIKFETGKMIRRM